MIQPIQYYQPQHPQLVAPNQQAPYYACTSCQLPTPERNYCVFDKNEVDYFVKQCLTDITTWHDNSMVGRKYSGMNFALRKKFNCKLPE